MQYLESNSQKICHTVMKFHTQLTNINTPVSSLGMKVHRFSGVKLPMHPVVQNYTPGNGTNYMLGYKTINPSKLGTK
jgi:hypothetical protein